MRKFMQLAITGIIIFILVLALRNKFMPYQNGKHFAGFSKDGEIEEASAPDFENNDFWWLSSGGIFYAKGEEGSTIQGDLAANSKWARMYQVNNPTDTDNGIHPQNIFRLVTKKTYLNYTQELYFTIIKNNVSDSPNRNESNGVLLFNRYQDSYNLYYAGVRVDGYAVIKKKIGGQYYTMGLKKIFDGKYDGKNNSNLLPEQKRIGIRTEVKNISDSSVNIRLLVDKDGNGNWVEVLNTDDVGSEYGGPPFLNDGHAGIRTDFMDVVFTSFSVQEMK